MPAWPVCPEAKIQRNKHSVSSPQLYRVVRFLPPPLWELLLKQTATGQDVATLSFRYLRPTLQMAYHNKCMSAVQDILRVSRPLADCEVVYERDGEKRLARHTQMQEERGKNIKRYECISCCYCCVPPAGVNSDQRPFIIWYCQNIKLYSAFN